MQLIEKKSYDQLKNQYNMTSLISLNENYSFDFIFIINRSFIESTELCRLFNFLHCNNKMLSDIPTILRSV